MARRPDPRRGTVSRGQLGTVGGLNGTPVNGTVRRGPGILFVLLLAILVLGAIVVLARPAVGTVARSLAETNPAAMRLPFVADLVRDQLGDRLTTPASSQATPVRFKVPEGATAGKVGDDLVAQGLVTDRLALDYLVVTRGLDNDIQAGTYVLRKNMTPVQVVERLAQAPEQTVSIALREGLRIEQITAYLETLGLDMNVADFYNLVTKPPASLRKDYSFLSTLPAGRSLEGYLGSGTFEVYNDVTADKLVRTLLDQWKHQVGDAPIAAAAKQGRNFYSVLALASIVEREATLVQEKPLIAGVYQKRLDRGMLLQSDPTVFYGYDTTQLQQLQLADWPTYAFWKPPGKPLKQIDLTGDLSAYQTYRHAGMIPGPICTPTIDSIRAALDPDASKGYLYFVAIPNGGGAHAFARTYDEHLANLKKYGYT
jgi:peptidoglycan lytic transglycosylase G